MDLESATNGLRDKAAAGLPFSAIIKFDFGDEGKLRLDTTKTPPVVDNEDSDADCTVAMSFEDFQAIRDGTLNSQMAFMSGKLQVQGDMSLAMQLSSVLN